MHPGKFLTPDKSQALLKHRFRLPGEAHDDVRRDGDSRHFFAYPRQEALIPRCVIETMHLP